VGRGGFGHPNCAFELASFRGAATLPRVSDASCAAILRCITRRGVTSNMCQFGKQIGKRYGAEPGADSANLKRANHHKGPGIEPCLGVHSRTRPAGGLVARQQRGHRGSGSVPCRSRGALGPGRRRGRSPNPRPREDARVVQRLAIELHVVPLESITRASTAGKDTRKSPATTNPAMTRTSRRMVRALVTTARVDYPQVRGRARALVRLCLSDA
jgi:hypothetical protein